MSFTNDSQALKIQIKMGIFSGKLKKDALAHLRKLKKEEKNGKA